MVDAIEALGGRERIQLIHDTFHHHLAGESEILTACAGIVHVSGVGSRQLSLRPMRDHRRSLVGEDDMIGNIKQLDSLQSSGYPRTVSFEAFSPVVHAMCDPTQKLVGSMDLTRSKLVGKSA